MALLLTLGTPATAPGSCTLWHRGAGAAAAAVAVEVAADVWVVLDVHLVAPHLGPGAPSPPGIISCLFPRTTSPLGARGSDGRSGVTLGLGVMCVCDVGGRSGERGRRVKGVRAERERERERHVLSELFSRESPA